MSAKRPPVLIISYSRPDGVRNLIQACTDNGVSDVYVAIDGPKMGSDGRLQNEILQVISSFSNVKDLNIRVLQRQKNLGVGVGVITAIDWFFSQEKFGHILEDDLKVDSGYFNFSREALTKFTNDKNVFIISGTEITGNNTILNSAHWCNYPMIWGWSTWADRWIIMRQGLLERKKTRFPLLSSARHNFWAVGANRVLDGKVDTWDTPLAAEFISNQWLCLIPPRNLVSNFGNDANASHTFNGSHGLNLPIHKFICNVDFRTNFTETNIKNYNKQLEKEVFKIQRKHALLAIYSRLKDRDNHKRVIPPLIERLDSV
jgi:hypothetical protein